MIALRILIDMDGVVADFLSHWCYLFNNRYPAFSVKPSDITDWYMHRCIPYATQEMCEGLMLEPGFFLHLPLIHGAKDAIGWMADEGHEIVFVTACQAGHEDKLAWLKRYFGEVPHKVVFTHHKHLVAGDVLIDDRPLNLYCWSEENPQGQAICFAQPYNHHYQGTRALDWVEVVERLFP